MSFAVCLFNNINCSVTLFQEHLQTLRDNYVSDDDIPEIVEQMTTEQIEFMLLSQPALKLAFKNRSLASITILDIWFLYPWLQL